LKGLLASLKWLLLLLLLLLLAVGRLSLCSRAWN
jgi:hypothetical protein